MPSKYSPRSGGKRADRCRECGRHRDEVGRMSARDLCIECAKVRRSEAVDQISAKSGPHYDEWARGMRSFIDRLPA